METREILLSSDLNGTLIHRHTMSDMIRIFLGKDKFKKADEVFKRQTSGTATMKEAFSNAGPLTKGLTLNQAVGYTLEHMEYVNGFDQFAEFLSQHKIPLVINSTGYSVTIFSIMEMLKRKSLDVIHGQIGNTLCFEKAGKELTNEELQSYVKNYFISHQDPVYDYIQASGKIMLGLKNEDAKAEKIIEYAAKHFPRLPTNRIIHMGDTFGDSGGILGIAKAGGIGIAFNYNQVLEDFLKNKIETENIPGKIYFIDPKDKGESNLENVVECIKSFITKEQL